MMYWQKEIETMDRKDLVKFQLERLKQTIELAGNSPFYHKIFKEKGITPDRDSQSRYTTRLNSPTPFDPHYYNDQSY